MVERADEPEALASESLVYLLKGRLVVTNHEVDVIVLASLPPEESIHAPSARQPSPDSFGGEFVQDRKHL
jgi:hypothetical protein